MVIKYTRGKNPKSHPIGHPVYGGFKKGNQLAKGHTPWNKDKKGVMPTPWNKDKHIYCGGKRFEKGQIPWNKGLKGYIGGFILFKKGNIPWDKGIKRPEVSGKNHWNWKNGKSFEPYPLGWNKTYKEQIRYRDGYKCQICGIPETECLRKLCVHHIDYNKKNIHPDNLISLCIFCHIKTNCNREYWKEYFNAPNKNAIREIQ